MVCVSEKETAKGMWCSASIHFSWIEGRKGFVTFHHPRSPNDVLDAYGIGDEGLTVRQILPAAVRLPIIVDCSATGLSHLRVWLRSSPLVRVLYASVQPDKDAPGEQRGGRDRNGRRPRQIRGIAVERFHHTDQTLDRERDDHHHEKA